MNSTDRSAPFAFLRSPRLLRILAWTVGITALAVVILWLAVPPLAKSLLERQLGEALHRKVTVAGLAIHPFSLAADLQGLSVQSPEGQEILGVDALHADLEAASLTRGGLVVREVRVDGPRVQVTRISRDRYDISDLLDEWSKPSDAPPPHFAVSNIQVAGGKVVFVDKPKGTTHTVTDLALRLPFVSNLPDDTEIFVEPHFSARINGSPLVLEGRSKPFSETRESELRLDLDKLALATYLPYSPVPLPFRLNSGLLDTELKLVFQQNHTHPAALKLVGALHLRDLAVADEGGSPLLAWKKLDVTVREADLLHRRFAVESIRLEDPSARVALSPEGKLNWAELAARLGGSPAATPKAPAGPAPAWSVEEIRIANGSVEFQDKRIADLPAQVVDRIDLRVKGLSSQEGSQPAVALAARANGSGTVKVEGDVRMQPLVARLELEAGDLPILPLQPYFGDQLNLTVTRGRISARGSLDLRQGKDGLEGGFKGKLALNDLASVDKADHTDFLKWKSLSVGDADIRLQPQSVAIGEIALSDFYARLIVSPQGRLNLMDIVRKPQPAPEAVVKTAKPGSAKAAPVAAAPAPAGESRSLPVRIGKVILQGGTINFSDYFVKPNYSVNVTRIGGRVNGLSSAPNSLADMELRGNYGNTAPVEILAKLNPFAATAYLDLKGEIRGVDLTTLSAYSGKYAGYAIEKGKLSLYVTYHLEQNQLSANNRVFLDQLTFGDKVDSPQATSLPVKLAIALLKNSRGEIDVNLPISGSLNDPEFSLGGIIVRVIGNLIVKAVSAPFSFLGSLFGGGEELSTLDFAPGGVDLDGTALKRLEALAKAMNDRPALKLEITGHADPEADREGIKRLALERAVRAEKAKEVVKKRPGTPPEMVRVDPEEYAVYLEKAYKEAKFPKPRNVIGLQKGLPVPEMEKLMLANVAVGEEDLRQLAERRAEVVQAWLVEQGKVAMERLFLIAPKLGGAPKDKASPHRVDFSLR